MRKERESRRITIGRKTEAKEVEVIEARREWRVKGKYGKGRKMKGEIEGWCRGTERETEAKGERKRRMMEEEI